MTTGLDFKLLTPGSGVNEDDWMEDLADKIIANVTTGYMPALETNFTFTGVEVFNHNAPQFGFQKSASVAGSVAGNSLSLRSAPVVSKFTALRGRTYRGRMYLMSPVETEQADGVLTVGYQGTLGGFISSLLNFNGAIFGANYDAAVWSNKLQSSQGITSLLVRPVLGSVRKRQRNS
jgi:hypothetical protein